MFTDFIFLSLRSFLICRVVWHKWTCQDFVIHYVMVMWSRWWSAVHPWSRSTWAIRINSRDQWSIKWSSHSPELFELSIWADAIQLAQTAFCEFFFFFWGGRWFMLQRDVEATKFRCFHTTYSIMVQKKALSVSWCWSDQMLTSLVELAVWVARKKTVWLASHFYFEYCLKCDGQGLFYWWKRKMLTKYQLSHFCCKCIVIANLNAIV